MDTMNSAGGRCDRSKFILGRKKAGPARKRPPWQICDGRYGGVNPLFRPDEKIPCTAKTRGMT